MENQGPRLRPQDLQNARDCKCEKCESTLFTPVFNIKVISALVSPTGQEVHVPIQTFACAKCSHVNAEFMPSLDT